MEIIMFTNEKNLSNLIEQAEFEKKEATVYNTYSTATPEPMPSNPAIAPAYSQPIRPVSQSHLQAYQTSQYQYAQDQAWKAKVDEVEQLNYVTSVFKAKKKIDDERKIRMTVGLAIDRLQTYFISSDPSFGPYYTGCLPFPLPQALKSIIAGTKFSDLSAWLLWCVCATIATGNKVKIQCDDNWQEVTSLIINVISASGSKKSALINKARKAFNSFIKKRNKNNIKKEEEREFSSKVLKLLEKDYIVQAYETLSLFSSKEEKQEYLKRFAERACDETGIVEKDYAILLEAFTLIGLFKHLTEHFEQVGILTAEADALIALLLGKDKDPSFFNKLHNQEPYTRVTGHKSYKFESPTLSMASLIQPIIANKLYSNKNLRDTGAAARILPYFDPMIMYNLPSHEDGQSEQIFNDKIINILEKYHDDTDEKFTASLTKEAYRRVKAFESEVEYSIMPNAHKDSYPTLRKLHGYAVRFAWAIHLFYDDAFHETPITEGDMTMAIEICRHLLPHIHYAYDPAGLQAEETAIKIIEWFKRIDLKIDTIAYGYTDSRTIQQSIHRSAKEVGHALAMLKRFSYVDVIHVGRAKNIVVPHPQLIAHCQTYVLQGHTSPMPLTAPLYPLTDQSTVSDFPLIPLT